jgi:hypothetical protein
LQNISGAVAAAADDVIQDKDIGVIASRLPSFFNPKQNDRAAVRIFFCAQTP